MTSMTHAKAIDTANEVITSIRTVKSMAGEEKENFRFKKYLNQVNRIITGKALTSGISMSVVNFSLWMSCAVAFCKSVISID
jgi:ATP-binding cassette subfamily B (MDR/TAP) protein 1